MIRAEDDTTDDLIALARRGDLPQSEELHLREQLAIDDEARDLYDVGLAFDAEAPVQPDDGARLARIVNAVDKRVRSGGKVRPLRRRRIVFAGLAAAMLLCAGVGAVVLVRRSESRPAISTTPAAPDQPTPAGTPPMEPALDREPPPVPPPTEPTIVPPTEPPKPIPPRAKIEPRTAMPSSANTAAAPGPVEAAPSPEEATAEELFAAANRARVRQDLAEAIRLSKQLVERFPQSPQAKTTHLSLALMYLQSKQPALALDELHIAPPSAEVLWAESQALRDLGRSADEKTTLEALVARYPASAYTSAARARLGALH